MRLIEERLPRAEAPGETVDAELAAALDRLSADHGAGPTPAIIGIDLLGLETPAGVVDDDRSRAGVDADLAAETPLSYQPLSEPQALVPPEQSPAEFAGPSGHEDFELDLSMFDAPAAPVEAQTEAVAEPEGAPQPLPAEVPLETAAAQSGEAAAEPVRPFARGKSGERRRSPSRYGRIDTPPADAGPSEPETGVPRAFEQPRPTPSSRAVPDFELLTRPGSSRPPVVPVLIGLAAGLILGLAGGFWLGSRNAPPVASGGDAGSDAGRGASAPVSASPSPAVSARPMAQQVDTAPAGPPAAAAPAPAAPISAPASSRRESLVRAELPQTRFVDLSR